MIIQQGKFYRDTIGRKRGPMVVNYGTAWVQGKTEHGDPEWMLDGTPDEEYMADDDALVAEWVEHGAPKNWAQMTREERREISFRAMSGEKVQLYAQGYGWGGWDGETPFCEIPFPIRIKPKRETIHIVGFMDGDHFEAHFGDPKEDTHHITFDVIDGKPDPDTIRMEVLA